METGPIYQLRPADVYSSLETSPEGLSASEAVARRDLFGVNALTEEQKPHIWRQFISQVTYPMALLLMGAGGVALVSSQFFIGSAIWVLVLVNGLLSFAREYRAEQAIDALRRLLPEYSRVMRDGVESNVISTEIVPGDVLLLAEGDHIPADARVVEEYGLRTNNATLTGDAIPARKSSDASLRSDISEVERPNLIFAGTSVVSGTGRAVVYATGMLTQFGRIAHLTQVVAEEPSQVHVELSNLARKIAYVASGIGLAVVLVGVLDAQLGWNTLDAFLLGLGIVAAIIPEGLNAILTLAQAMAGQRLAQQGVLVKKLSVLEKLGTVSTICTDKSGTLTQNQMTAREVWVAGNPLSISGVGYEPYGVFSPDPAGLPYADDLRALLIAAMCCNNARLSPPAPGKPQWTCLGDQTEAAMRVAALKGGIDEAQVAHHLPRIHELPFDARRKRMSTIHQVMGYRDLFQNGGPDSPGGYSVPAFHPRVAFVKGAPREILQICSHILVNGKAQPLNNPVRQQILDTIDDYAQRTLRVLAVARRSISPDVRSFSPNNIEYDLTFLGLIAMHDPPRPQVTEAIQALHQAGIRMFMITGDYGLTALSLARRVGMLTTDEAQIITGAELDELDEIALRGRLNSNRELLFARMAPEHKLRLVATLQNTGYVVAVTGDGVNDAPALRKADVGISMGIIGTDVAIEAADVILTDDNFASVVHAIREGRALFDNLRKFITYIFSSNVPEVIPFLVTALTHIPLALGVNQILAIDLGTDVLPALGLGSEKPEPDVMRRPPRPKDKHLVDRFLLRRSFTWLGMIETFLCYAGFLLVFYLSDRMYLISDAVKTIHPPEVPWPAIAMYFADLSNANIYSLAITVFYAGLVMAQVGNAFACRAETNRGRSLGWTSNIYLLIGVIVEVLLLLIVIYFPPVARWFEFYPLPAIFWLWLAPYPLVLYVAEWIRKAVVRKLQLHPESVSSSTETGLQ